MNLSSPENQEKQIGTFDKDKEQFGLIKIEAFLTGMRALGYKDPGWAIAEMIDNSIQAGATTTEILFGPEVKKGRPGQLAVFDDGCGMIPEMLPYAIMWGGTERANDRTGFGRFGFGLPSAAISIGARYSVYSKTTKQDFWSKQPVDFEKMVDEGHNEETSSVVQEDPPAWVYKQIPTLRKAEHGTVIVLEDLRNLKHGWQTAAKLKSALKSKLGMIYRHWLPSTNILVNGDQVDQVDPLFLLESARGFRDKDNPVQAIGINTHIFEMEGPEGKKGIVSIRASYLPANFHYNDPDQPAGQKEKFIENRWKPMKDEHGLLITREGRHIDTIKPPSRFYTWQSYDMHVKIELDFTADLDGFFGMTTAKQQIRMEDHLWDKLFSNSESSGRLKALIKDMRIMHSASRKEHDARVQNLGTDPDKVTQAEQAMEDSRKFKSTKKLKPSKKLKEEAEANLKAAVSKKRKELGQTEQEAHAAVGKETTKAYRVGYEQLEGAPYIRPMRLVDQIIVKINTAHPFYSRHYARLDPKGRQAVDVLFLAQAECELESPNDDQQRFHQSFRQAVSERTRQALSILRSDDDVADERERLENVGDAETS